MSPRGFEDWTEADVQAHNARVGKLGGLEAVAVGTTGIAIQAKPSKWRNVKTVVDGITFDSKREAEHYMLLKARQALGEISELQRQVPFQLLCPVLTRDGQSTGASAVVAAYVSDFTYRENGQLVIVDAKGKRTREYALKAKWLALQQGISILEV